MNVISCFVLSRVLHFLEFEIFTEDVETEYLQFMCNYRNLQIRLLFWDIYHLAERIFSKAKVHLILSLL